MGNITKNKLKVVDVSSEITIGADPEWVLMGEDGRPINASRVMGDSGLPNGGVGCDGTMQPQAELRPYAHVSPVRVVEDMVVRLNTDPLAKLFAKYQWYVGSGVGEVTTCGHIHFGGMGLWGPRRFSERWMKNMNGGDNRYEGVLEMLDEFLMPFAILLTGDNSVFDVRKVHVDGHGIPYGDLRGIRQQPHGFEYRTLPSWLYSPMTALFFLAAAKAVAVEKLADNIDVHEYCERVPISQYVFRNANVQTLRSLMHRRLNQLEQDLRTMNYFVAHPELLVALEYVVQLIRDGTTWDNVDVRNNWLGYDMTKLPKVEEAVAPPSVKVVKYPKHQAGTVDVPPDLLNRLLVGERYVIYRQRGE